MTGPIRWAGRLRLGLLALLLGLLSCSSHTPIQREPPFALSLALLAHRFPGAAQLLHQAAEHPARLVGEGEQARFELRPPLAPTARSITHGTGVFRPAGAQFGATVGLDASAPLRLETTGRGALSVRRVGASASKAQLDGGAVVYPDAMADVDAVTFATNQGVEELLLMHGPEARLAYRVELPAGWTLRQSPGFVALVEVRDERGTTQIRMSASKAWDAAGNEVIVEPVAQGSRVELRVWGAHAWPVLVDPEWQGTGTMAAARQRHTTTLLPTGRVLVAGGDEAGTAEEYDPLSRSFTALGPMLNARTGHTATLLPTGQVLLAGGTHAVNMLESSEELYDPVARSFSPVGSLLVPRVDHAATLLANGSVLLTGGTGTSPGDLATAETYDPKTKNFTSVGAMKLGRRHHLSTLLSSGSVLITGGSSGLSASASAELFDPNSSVFELVVPMATARTSHTATLLPNGLVLVAGGVTAPSSKGAVDTAEVFDPNSAQFVAISSKMQEPRVHHTSSLLPSGKVLLAGGDYGEPFLSGAVTGAELYDPVSQSFSSLSSMLSAREFHSATILASGQILMTGGMDDSAATLASSELYDPKGGYGGGAVGSTNAYDDYGVALLPSGKALISGGKDQSGSPLTTAQIYDPYQGSISDGGAMTATRAGHTATVLASGEVLLAGGGDAQGAPQRSIERYDASSGFVATGMILTARQHHTATTLLSGQILFAGGDMAGSAELYDTVTQISAKTGSLLHPRLGHVATRLGSGQVLVAGGVDPAGQPVSTIELYDPFSATFKDAGSMAGVTAMTTLADGQALLSGDGVVARFAGPPAPLVFSPGVQAAAGAIPLLSGGTMLCDRNGCATVWPGSSDPLQIIPHVFSPVLSFGKMLRLATGSIFFTIKYQGENFSEPSSSIEFMPQNFPVRAPLLTSSSVPGLLVPGAQVPLQGEHLSSASVGGQSDPPLAPDPSHLPLALFMPDAGGGPIYGPVQAWSDTSVTWTVPRSVLRGTGRLHVVVDGVPSVGVFTVLGGVAQASACSAVGECLTGFCTQGVCCDQACQSGCESCLADPAITGSKDGVCRQLPAGSLPLLANTCLPDPTNSCGPTGTCDGSGQCDRPADFSACPAGLPNSGKVCVGGQCVVPPPSTCDASHTGALAPDGTVTSCAPYRCPKDKCLTQCAADSDCVKPSVCRKSVCSPACDAGESSVVESTVTGTQITSCGSLRCMDGTCIGQCNKSGSAVVAPDGSSTSCAPYTCQNEACQKACASDMDCISPSICVNHACSPACDVAGVNVVEATPGGTKTTACASLSCKDGVCSGQCDKDGISLLAPSGMVTSCTPYRCAKNNCLAGCTTSVDCASPSVCRGGLCKPSCDEAGLNVVEATASGPKTTPCASQACKDGACAAQCDKEGLSLLSGDGTPTTCAPYRCQQSACLIACTSSAQCASGAHCSLDGHCIPDATTLAPTDPGACSVSGPLTGKGRRHCWLVFLLTPVLLRRKRSRRRSALALSAAAAWAVGQHALVAHAQAPAAPPASASATPPAAPPASAAAPGPAGSSAPPADARIDEARAELRKGLALLKADDPERALAYFLRSRALYPAKGNALNAAICLDRLHRYDEALELYQDVVANYSSTFDDDDKASIPQAMAELRKQVGSLRVSANVTGGSVVIDGRERGKLPLASAIRLLPGSHRVRVLKDGYASFEKAVEITVNAEATLDASLDALQSSGGLRVEDPTLPGADIAVDGVVVGASPWEGTLAPGPHVVSARKGETGSAPTLATVLAGQTTLLRLRSLPLGPSRRLSVSPPSADIRLNDVPLGKGRWEGPLPSGAYQLAAAEEGYFPKAVAFQVVPEGGPPDRDVAVALEVDQANPRWPKRPSGHVVVSAQLGYGLTGSLGGSAEADCPAACSSHGLVSGLFAGLRGGFEFPFRLSLELSGGHASLSGAVVRSKPAGKLDGTGGPVTYEVHDLLRLNGYWLGGGVSYRLPLGTRWSLRGRATGGVLFARSSDTLTGTANAASGSLPFGVQGGGDVLASTPPFLWPELGAELVLGEVTVGATLGAFLVPSQGPVFTRGPATVPTICPPTNPAAVGCAADSGALQNERAYKPFVVFLPELGASYVF